MASSPSVVGLLAFSPRIVGETVYFGGKAVGGIKDVAGAFGISTERLRLAAMGAYQLGQAEQISAREIADRVMGATTVDEAIAAAEELTTR